MIRITNLNLTYRTTAGFDYHAVRGLSLSIEQGDIYTLLGPSGCGKTTTLRCVAGLETPDSGEIVVGGRTVFSSEKQINIPAFERRIGMVFQSYAIWPHMTVFENVAFPLRYQAGGLSRQQMRDRVEAALAMVQLGGMSDRPAPNLSGGQQQRLALARALVGEPKSLLLDEPLSNLDAKLREDMRIELKELVERVGITTMFVTHEQIEALALSDRVGLMQDGNIVQEGRPTNIYEQPQTPFVADFIGTMNFLNGRVVTVKSDGDATVESPIGPLTGRKVGAITVGAAVKIAIRPENLFLIDTRQADEKLNNIAARVMSKMFLGNHVSVTLSSQDVILKCEVHPTARIEVGTEVNVAVAVEHCLILRDDP